MFAERSGLSVRSTRRKRQAGAVLHGPGDRQRGEHDGQVRLDGVAAQMSPIRAADPADTDLLPAPPAPAYSRHQEGASPVSEPKASTTSILLTGRALSASHTPTDPELLADPRLNPDPPRELV